MDWFVIIGLLGGLGLFIYGLQIMSSGMQKVAGDRLKRTIEVLTSKPIIGVLTGIMVTVLVQSSSTTTIMLVGLVNTGLMNLSQAMGAIMGANIGTTVTAQIISFELDYLALPAIGIGALLNFIAQKRFYQYLGQSILGFGLLFLGMSTMSEAMYSLRESTLFLDLLVGFAENPLLGVLSSAIFTAAIQSSTGATGVIIALTLQDLITLEAAIPLILGVNVGTSITVLIAGLGTSLAARRTAMAHIIFNLLGVGIVLLIIGPFTSLVLQMGDTVARQTANAHSFFNIMNTVLVFPFYKYFVRLVEFAVPGKETSLEFGPKYLDKKVLRTPVAGIQATRQELFRMANIAREMVRESIDFFYYGDRKKIAHINQKKELIDGLEESIYLYMQNLSQQSLTLQQSTTISGLMSAANNLERIGDYSQNILELAEATLDKKIESSNTTVNEVYSLYEKVDEMFEKAIRAFSDENKELAKEVVKMDNEVDELKDNLRQNLINRIKQQECLPDVGVNCLDILSNLKKVADHANKLSQIVLGKH